MQEHDDDEMIGPEQTESLRAWIEECNEADRARSQYPAYGVDDDEMETSRHNHGVSHANA
jgi:hypothetical protein